MRAVQTILQSVPAALTLKVSKRGYADSAPASGSVNRPAADAVIAQTALLPAGVYEVYVQSFQHGTVDAATPLNGSLRNDGTEVSKLLTAATPATIVVPRVTVADQKRLTVNAVAQPAVGSIVDAVICATRIE